MVYEEESMHEAPIDHRRAGSRRGLTLLEMMIVIVLIGILTRLAYVRFNLFQKRAELSSSAQKLAQIMSWTRLESEKRGDTLLIQFALPEIRVYADANANGLVDPADKLLLRDSLRTTVRAFKPSFSPTPAPAAAPSGAYASGGGTCGPTTCCEAARTSGSPTWAVSATSGVAVCARTFPAMPSLLEEGAVYLESTLPDVTEKWALLQVGTRSANPTLWRAESNPVARTDWRQIR